MDNSAFSDSVSLMTDGGRSFEVVSESSNSFEPEEAVLLELRSENEGVCNIVGESLAIRASVVCLCGNGGRGCIGGLGNPEDADEFLDRRRS